MIDLVFVGQVYLQQFGGELEYLSWGPQPEPTPGEGDIEYSSWSRTPRESNWLGR